MKHIPLYVRREVVPYKKFACVDGYFKARKREREAPLWIQQKLRGRGRRVIFV